VNRKNRNLQGREEDETFTQEGNRSRKSEEVGGGKRRGGYKVRESNFPSFLEESEKWEAIY
jgi:hypothetical protein